MEPLKGMSSNLNMNSNSTSHVDTISTGHSLSENEGANYPSTFSQMNNLNDDDPSISEENTLSSDKQIQSQFIKKKKVTYKIIFFCLN